MPESDMQPNGDNPDEVLVFRDKSIWSVFAGLLLVCFGCACFWLASMRPGEKNAWVPWIVGALFSGVGAFSVLAHTKTTFDPLKQAWTDAWGFLFLEFSQHGTFDQLTEVVIEESDLSEGTMRYYIWVKGRGRIRLLPEICSQAAEARKVAQKLSDALGLPIRTIHT
jgi:hypothetical protein